MKRLAVLLSAALFFACVLGVSACSGNASGDGSTLLIAYENSGYGDAWMDAMVEGFRAEHPEVTVKAEGDSQLHTKVLRELDDASAGWDIIFTQGVVWNSYAASGKLVNLNDVYASTDENGITLEQRMLPNIVKFGRTLGQDGREGYYSFPYGLSVMGIVYNVEMFEHYGWNVPKTYGELLTLCQRIKRDTAREHWTTKDGQSVQVAPFTYPGQHPDYWRAVTYPWSAQYDGIDRFESFYEYTDKASFYTAGRLESLKALEGLNIEGPAGDRNALEGTMSKDHLASQNDFALGYAAMIPNGSWVETEIAKSLDDVYEMAMMPPIAFDEAHADSAFWSNNSNHVLIPSASDNTELAKEFLKFVCRKENAFQITRLSNSFMPLSYDYSEIRAQMSSFGQSVVDIWTDSYCLVGVSTNPMRTYDIGEDWPGVTEPCALIMQGVSAEEVMRRVRTYTDDNWDRWVAEVEALFR